ncbi:MAG: nicotinate phosphoribosyltransferase [Synergistaceae bacterium]|jgi:nicotinate phosphoribosyltransferase|nr:nicotinate phosphoribosyltransferase [Synergistaceae bacterium]
MFLDSVKDVSSVKAAAPRFASATHEEIRDGATTDVYFVNTRDVLASVGRLDVKVAAEIFAREHGLFAGVGEVLTLLKGLPLEIEALPEGEEFGPKETLMRIRGSYRDFGLYETAMLGFLASSSGWAGAAQRCVDAAGGPPPKGIPVLSFGARHLHPAVASVMDSVAVRVGGCAGASSVLGAALVGKYPAGTVPHSAVLLTGDTVDLAVAYDAALPSGIGRIFLVDTFKDEAEESLRLARALGDKLDAVRLDTPGERGGVTPDLVREVRYRLDKAGFDKVKIVVTGGLTPYRIVEMRSCGADVFGVGSYIAHADPVDMTLDIKEIEGRAVAKRGRLPGILENPRLVRVQ